MGIYFSAKHNQTFDGAEYGEQILYVNDNEAFREELDALRERENEAFKLEGDAFVKEINEINALRKHITANPPQKTIPNPDCKLPDDAVLMTDDLVTTLLEAVDDETKTINIGLDGYPIVTDAQMDPEALRVYAYSIIDAELNRTDRYELPSYRERKGEERYQEQMAYREGLRDLRENILERVPKDLSVADAQNKVLELIETQKPK